MLDLNQRATVRWLVPAPSGEFSRNGGDRHFDNLSNAIRFVVEDLQAEYRGTAFIDYEGGSLSIEDIETEYAKL